VVQDDPEKLSALAKAVDSNEGKKNIDAKPSAAGKKPNKTAIILIGSTVGLILLCIVLTVIGNNTGKPAPVTPLPPFQATMLAGAYGQIVHTASGQPQTLDCGRNAGLTIYLPDGDSAFVRCPADTATLTSLGIDQLPGALDPELIFISAVELNVSPSVSGTVRVEFAPPDVNQLNGLTILHWSGTQWEQQTMERLSATEASTAGIFVFAHR